MNNECTNLKIAGIEKRLQARYEQLVQEHAGDALPIAAGPRLLPSDNTPEAAAMGAWRFFHNPRITFSRLAQPLLQAAADSAARYGRDFALVPLDWSWLDYSTHTSKTDRALGPGGLLGYKLLSALLLSDQDGQPLAPLVSQLLTRHGLLSSRLEQRTRSRSPLDELAVVMDFVKEQPLTKRPVFIIDAEADSVFHYRQWHQRGLLFLVRADQERVVRLGHKDGPERSLLKLARQLRREHAFTRTRTVDYHGQKVGQYVAETSVVLDRVAWLNRVVDGQRKRLCPRGVALELRLVITELRDDQGRLLERWYPLTNVPAEVQAATLALWYYWRWKIETFFKLLKSAGQQLEHWQQEDGATVLKRLLVASMACVLAWRLAHSQAPQAAQARRLVMSLSGRQVEHDKDWTLEGLLAGTWTLLAMRVLLEQMSAAQIKEIADFVLHGSVTPSPATPAPAPLPLREAG